RRCDFSASPTPSRPRNTLPLPEPPCNLAHRAGESEALASGRRRVAMHRTVTIRAAVLLGAFWLRVLAPATAAGKLHFAVGPLLPTPTETTKAWDPFFKHLAGKLGVDYDLVATTDWAGVAVALANNQVDLAWMGPWGYVLANDDSGAQAIA